MTVSAGSDSKTPKAGIAFYCEEVTLSFYLALSLLPMYHLVPLTSSLHSVYL